MFESNYHLAQINIAVMRAPLDSPVMAGFVARLDEINQLAERSPGFVWRLKGDGNDATSLRPFEDERIIVNMTVWESIDALFQYTYGSDHVEVFRQRGEWFEKMETPHMALWWIPAGHIPTVEEAKEKLERLHHDGATPLAFTFKRRFTMADVLAYSPAQDSSIR